MDCNVTPWLIIGFTAMVGGVVLWGFGELAWKLVGKLGGLVF